MISVASATMPFNMKSCRYSLYSENSQIENIHNTPMDLELQNSTVGQIITTNTISRMNFYNSAIGNLSAESIGIMIRNSNVTHIDNLRGIRTVFLLSTSIGSIAHMECGFLSLITDSNIKVILSGALLVRNRVIIDNTTIDYLDRNAIVMLEGGELTMDNVTIKEGWLNSFNYSVGKIRLKNVKLNGGEINNIDVIDANEHLTSGADEQSAPTTQSVSTGASTTTEIVHSTQHSTTSHNPGTQRVGPTMAADSPAGEPQPVQLWAGIGAAIFIALVISLVSVSIVVAVR